MRNLVVFNNMKSMPPSNDQPLARNVLAIALSVVVLAMFFVLTPDRRANAESYGVFPACNTPTVENRIVERYNYAEEKQWRRGYQMSALLGMHEHRTELWDDSIVIRRYCSATAQFSNGSKHQVYFLIEDNGGFAGKTWGLTYCVSGLDPWRNHDGNCRTMK